MKSSNSRLFLLYFIIVIIILGIIGTIIIPLTSGIDRIIVGFILVGGLTAFSIFVFYIFDRYIIPVKQTAKVAEEIAKGNYNERTSVNYYWDIAKINHSLNVLAKSLQEMTIHGKNQDTQLRTVIDNMESGLMMIDAGGYVQLINRTFLHIFGGQAKDYIGFLYYEILAEENIHHVVQETFLYEEKIKKSFEISPSTVDTKEKHVEIVSAPLLNDKQNIKGAVLVLHDITELKRVEQMRKDFVANVSHELKTPITSIRGFTETLIDGAAKNEELRNQFLSIILTESQRLQVLVADLLELSKLDKDEQQLNYTKVNIHKLMQGILPLVKQQANKKDINFQWTVDKSIEIDGDEGLLQQVFLNILSNAFNYTPNGGKVVLEVTRKKEAIQILIADTGIGIPENMQSRIFERFFRVDRARSRDTGGTGLGLAIVKHIVEAHKGTIQVKSERDLGSTFTITIPRKVKTLI
ncbi:ATP-binding protein [Lentibacillus sp. N15]|uniref:two-component system histidine kinase PnpS n=1 Tax=Lentibacillus songyuanensis TaxID=3136161 RepID=UPI0031BB9448